MLQRLLALLQAPAPSAEERYDRLFAETDEYLEKILSESYKREIDLNEAVWRTLPVFATSLGFLFGLIGYISTKLPAPSCEPFVILAYATYLASFLCGVISFCWLFYAVRARNYLAIPLEIGLLKFARGTKNHFQPQDMSKGEKDFSALTDLRDLMVDEYAKAVTHNRKLNKQRYLGRARSAAFLMIAAALAGALALALVWAEKTSGWNGSAAATRHKERQINVGQEATTFAPAAHAAPKTIPSSDGDDQGGLEPASGAEEQVVEPESRRSGQVMVRQNPSRRRSLG